MNRSFFIALLSLVALGLAVPMWIQDEYPPDLITVVNQWSGGGQYYLRSAVGQGLEGDLIIQMNKDVPSAYSTEHDQFAPNFFLRQGDLYSMTNETHVLQVMALNITDNTYDPGYSKPRSRYRLQLVDPAKADKNIGVGEGKYAPGKYSWYGPILLYAFGPQHDELKGTLFYSCFDGVYLDVHSGPPPSGCEPVTLHSRNILRTRFG